MVLAYNREEKGIYIWRKESEMGKQHCDSFFKGTVRTRLQSNNFVKPKTEKQNCIIICLS